MFPGTLYKAVETSFVDPDYKNPDPDYKNPDPNPFPNKVFWWNQTQAEFFFENAHIVAHFAPIFSLK